jgi:UTP--glucose-1-phosphate uridylyltransferase
VVAEAVAAGIDQIVFVTARGKDALIDYFDSSPALERHLEVNGQAALLAEVRRVARMARVVGVRQAQALGLGHAVLTARSAVAREPFAVLLGDDIVDATRPAIGQLADCAARTGHAVVALMEVPAEQTHRYGICAGQWVEARRMVVESMVEKPAPALAPSRHAIVGRYILPYEIFDIIERTPPGKGGEIQLTDAIAELAGQGRVSGLVFEGERFDTGNVLGLLRASLHYALARPELAAGVRELVAEFQGR